jgi:alanyl-tRNA synthetase
MLERISRDRKKRGGGIELEELIKLYDTHGIPPELTKEVAARMNVDVELPTDFYSKIASSHAKVEMEYDPLAERVKNLPKTRRIYYDECGDEFEAVVLDAFDDHIILDQTLFYPEGGGQPSDEGVISTPERVIRVTHVKDVDGVILHRVDEQIPRGEVILGRINLERRVALSRNHTATHVLLCAAKRVLGGHVWQSGAQKGVDRSRLDLLHYKRISGPELEEIERIANEIVMSNIIVNVSIEDRNEAERKYGFSIYQGGVPPGERIRIIRIAENVQACAGTHCKTTGEVGAIKILRCEGIQDGIERLEFAAGKAATREIQSISRKVHESADILRVPIDILPETTKKFFEEWKKQGKEIGRLKEELVKFRVDRMIGEVSVINGTKVMAKRMDLGMDELVKLAIELSKSGVVGILLGVHNGAKAVVSVPESDISKGISAVKIIKGICTILGGGGGGKEHLAQGGGPNVDKIPEAIRRGIELIE